jgi:tRNA (guanine-N7-)-methyltransferase
MTDAHRIEVVELMDRYGLAAPNAPDLGAMAARSVADSVAAGRGVIVEIGFGLGDSTAAMAAAEPDADVLAIDVHTPGVLRLLRLIDEADLTNVRVAEGDALEVLDQIPSSSLSAIRAYFPDPWPKAGHRHRRLCSSANIAMFVERLHLGGTLHIATDIASYAAEAEATMRAHPELVVERLRERPSWRASTKFERQGLTASRQIADLIATRRTVPSDG